MTMLDARQNILDRLEKSAPAATVPSSDFTVLANKQWSHEERISRFRSVAEAVNMQIIPVNPESWPEKLREILALRRAKTLALGKGTKAAREIKDRWDETDEETPQLVDYSSGSNLGQDKLFHVDAGFTTTKGAIAETGSLIVWPTEEEPRLLSLVPPIHIALLYESAFFDTFHQAIEQGAWAKGLPTNSLLISGPSKTADIEQELCYGVHGPKELIVLLVNDK